MHGTPAVGNQSMGDYSFSFGSAQPSLFNPELSEATTLKIAALQAKLNQKLGPEYISQRPGPGGGPKLTYAEGWKIINLANEVFGFNGWNSQVVSLTTDFIDFNEESRRYSVGVTAIIRVTLRDGVFHEDIGYGMLENSKGKGAALDKCKKEAVTDGLKRALRNFGNLLGNCLYDKTYTQEVVKIKVPPPKFDKSELHRRPEFEATKPSIASTSTHTLTTSSRLANISMNLPTNTEDVKPNITATSTSASSSRLAQITTSLPKNNNNASTRPSAGPHQQTKVLPSIPSHVRMEVNTASGSSHNAISLPVAEKNSFASGGEIERPMTNQSNNRPPQPEPVCHAADANSTNGAKIPISVHAGAPVNTSRSMALPQRSNEPIEAEDGDESFHFGSEDDAFLALVDLGDGDLGQPVLPETDLGRPLFNPEEEDNSVLFGEDIQAQSSHPRQQQSHAHGQHNAPPVGMLSRLLPQNQLQQRPSDQNQTGSNHPQHQLRIANNQFNPSTSTKPPSHILNEASRTNQNAASCRSHQNQNQPPGANTSMRRPSTPSVGGFHFPPGV
ncbi:hypothetical protein H0H87_008089, partial [Tephrocybe sp. NHM501043]